MKNRIEMLPGTPRRIRVSVPWRPEDKLDLPADAPADIVPRSVRIEVAGGRNSTRSAMRAARVQQALEEVGGTGHPVEIEGEYATLDAEADHRQMLHVARLPFVKRVSAC